MIKRNGFTTIELLVVIVLLGLIAGIAIPSFILWLPNFRLRAAANDLHANMQHAKMGSARDRSSWAIRFIPASNEYRVLSDDGGDGTWADGNETIDKTVVLSDYGSGVAFGHGSATNDIPGSGSAPADDITYTSDVAVFNMRGTCNGGYVYLENSNDDTFGVGTQTCGVVISRKWNGNTWD